MNFIISTYFQERKKKKGKKDKHGFTWTPFIRDEELPLPRTPQPQMLAVKPHIRPNGDISKSKNSTDFSLLRPRRNDDDIHNIAADNSAVPEVPAAVSDNKSESSFKTASSDPHDNLIPKLVSECYMKASSDSVALERKYKVLNDPSPLEIFNHYPTNITNINSKLNFNSILQESIMI